MFNLRLNKDNGAVKKIFGCSLKTLAAGIERLENHNSRNIKLCADSEVVRSQST
jgi:hypothetical protein